MAIDNDRSQTFTRRAVLIGGMQAAVFAFLAGRIFYLQVVEGEKYKTLAEENRISLRLVAPPRGQILDRFGAPLALNQQNFRVVLLPERVENLDELLDKLSHYVTIDDSDRRRVARELKDTSNLNAILVKDNVTRDEMEAIAVHSVDLPGTDIDTGEVRGYPYAEATAHVLGYVGTVSEKDLSDDDDQNVLTIPGFRIGKNGIEKECDAILRGEAGNVQMEVNAHGRVVRELDRNDPKPGTNVMLTIDIGLQQITAQRLAKEESAGAVLLDIQNGEVLALASSPSFDPQLFTYGISQDDWDRLNKDVHNPLSDKVISSTYAPGSTVKPMVALAGLEAGLMKPEDRTYCPGYFTLGNHRFHCWKHNGHGYVNLVEAIAGSCDVYFYNLSKNLGIDRIQAMYRRLGLGQKTGLELPYERAGFVPNRPWKLTNYGSTWQQGETLITGIGQGFMLATPLQLAVMAARIASGGMAVTPHLIKQIGATPSEPRIFSALGLDPKHLAIVQEAMAAVVTKPIGTAYAARIEKPEFAMGGKTGTAQVRRISVAEHRSGVIKNEDLPWKERDHALFTGFAPVGNPRYAVGVIAEHGGSGAHIAAPIARDILLACQMKAAKT